MVWGYLTLTLSVICFLFAFAFIGVSAWEVKKGEEERIDTGATLFAIFLLLAAIYLK